MWQLQIPDVLSHLQVNLKYHAGHPAALYCMTGAMTAITVMTLLGRPKNPLSKIPTVGSESWLGSWWDGLNFTIFHSTQVKIVQEGYRKHKGKPFKVSTLTGWLVILSGSQMIKDFFKSSDHGEFRTSGAFDEAVTGRAGVDDGILIPFVHKLNRNLASLYDEMKDEIVAAFVDLLDVEENEWKSVPLLPTLRQVISRASNRTFVGLPLCRVPEWVQLNINFTIDVFKTGYAIGSFPRFLSPLIRLCMYTVPRDLKRAEKLLTPLIEAQRKQVDGGRSQAGKPIDVLTTYIEGSHGRRGSTAYLSRVLLMANMAAIHTTSGAFAVVLYNLAANPGYAQVLREEVEPIIAEEGWSMESMSKMHKVDSFIKETKRMDASGFTSVTGRTAAKDLTLADGTVIPKGTAVAPASCSAQLDDEFFENAMTFDPLRFSKMRHSEDGNGPDDSQFTSIASTEYLPFSHGRHACLGRFFAAVELQTMLAYTVLSYDVKLEHEAIPGIGAVDVLKETAKILFRKRVV